MTTETTQAPFEEIIKSGPYAIRFPVQKGLDQDEEWCEVQLEGNWKRIRFHDYHEVYSIPGLYETIFYRTLRCVSPTEVISLFRQVVLEQRLPLRQMAALDFGAGNGMAGEALQSMGVRKIVGVDILPEAKAAAERDRPWVYNDYWVSDLSRPGAQIQDLLKRANLNMLITVAALGYGDIPADAFYHAFNLIAEEGWLAFNIKEEFLKSSSRKGFAGLMNRMYENDILRCEMYKRYCHRLSIRGEELFYISLVAKKLRNIPADLFESIR